MKILTLNTHSLQEENCWQKLEWIVAGILREKPDIVALQEVSQTAFAEQIDPKMLEGQYPVPGCMKIRWDNFAAQIAYRLNRSGVKCSWAWIPIRLSEDRYDEGVAILSLGRAIRCIDQFPISKSRDYYGNHTRAVLGVQVEGLEDWFYTLQMDSWEDRIEPFLEQWKRLSGCIASRRMCGPVWLLGDFQAPDLAMGKSYDHITACGWIDTFHMAEEKDSGITVPEAGGQRLDYIWCSQKQEVRTSKVLFNGNGDPVVSHHFGVLIETKE